MAFFSSHKGVKGKKSVSSSDDGSYTDISPYGTLTRASGASGFTSPSVDSFSKYRANAKAHSKLPSLFSPFSAGSSNSNTKTQDKHEQLNDILTQYSLHGLPKMPDILTRGRPHYDPSAFHLERHWTDIVANHESLNKRQRDQQEAVWELLSTEVEYLRKLRVVIDVFMCCLFNLQNEQLLTEIEVDKVFSNIGDVFYATCHFWVSHMGQVLRQARKTRELLDPCLLKAGFLVFDKIFEPYTKYCLEQDMCREYIKTTTMENDLFRAFVTWGEKQKNCNRLKLVDLIVKPWQRLTKYKLLLFAVLKPLDKMDPTFDVDEQKRDISIMIENVEKFLHHVNISMRHKHNHKQLSLVIDRIESYDAVDPPSDECDKLVSEFCKLDLTCPVPGCGQQEMRILLQEGALKLKDKDSKTDVYCFLFTDMLLITKPAARRGDKVKVIKPPMRLDKVIVCGLRDTSSFMLLYLNEYHVAQAVYTLHGDSRIWLDAIAKAQIEYKEKRTQYLSRADSLLFDLYDETDDDFGIYIDRALTPAITAGGSIEGSSNSTPSRCDSSASSTTGFAPVHSDSTGSLRPPSCPVQIAVDSAPPTPTAKSPKVKHAQSKDDTFLRLRRPRSAILRRGSPVDEVPTPRRSSRDDSEIGSTSLLTVPSPAAAAAATASPWYRTEVSANVEGQPETTTKRIDLTADGQDDDDDDDADEDGVFSGGTRRVESWYFSRVEPSQPQTGPDVDQAADCSSSSSRPDSGGGGGGADSRTMTPSSPAALGESTSSVVVVASATVVPEETVLPVYCVTAAPNGLRNNNNNNGIIGDNSQQNASAAVVTVSDALLRRRMTSAERRRIHEALLRNPSLEVSEV